MLSFLEDGLRVLPIRSARFHEVPSLGVTVARLEPRKGPAICPDCNSRLRWAARILLLRQYREELRSRSAGCIRGFR